MKKILPTALLLLATALSAQAQTSEFAQLVPSTYLPKDVNFSLGAAAISAPATPDPMSVVYLRHHYLMHSGEMAYF